MWQSNEKPNNTRNYMNKIKNCLKTDNPLDIANLFPFYKNNEMDTFYFFKGILLATSDVSI